MTTPSTRTALVVGATGINGRALIRQLGSTGWDVVGLSRRGDAEAPARGLAADLSDPDSLRAALADERPTHVFVTAWSRQETEALNIEVNAAMVRHLLEALRPTGSVQHVALVTGLKHYLGPFEAYASGDVPDTPFREDEPRLDHPNFYYAQEDELFAAAERDGFTWTVHRPHTVIGDAVGNAMNIAQTLAAYAAVCREQGRPFVFPGSETQWNAITDMTDAGLLAEHLEWASTTPAVADTALNVVNGDTFRWRRLWLELADALGVEAEGYADEPRPLEEQMAGVEPVWRELAERHGLVEADVDRVASWWHTDGDLGRPIETLTDMRRSREAGFTGYRTTLTCFTDTFARLVEQRVVPPVEAR